MPTPTPRVSVRTRRVALVGLAIVTFSLVIAATIVTYQRRQPPVQKINYSQLYGFAEAGGVPDPPVPRPAQLPPRVGHFTGRAAELKAKEAQAASTPAVVAPSVATPPAVEIKSAPPTVAAATRSDVLTQLPPFAR